jgi:uncharacterized protein DUF6893
MSDIRISPTAQVVALVALMGVLALGFVVQLPELRRYLKMRSM